MAISAQKLIEKFGLVFVLNLHEPEVTIEQVIKDDYLRDYFNTYDEAVESYKTYMKNKAEGVKQKIIEYEKAFKQFSFIRRAFFRTARGESFKKMIARLSNEADEILKQAEQKPKLIKFDESQVFPCDGFDGEFVKVGDVFYDVVTNWNGLDIGIYKGVVESADYATRFGNEVSLRGTLEIKEPNKNGEIESHYFDLRYGKDGIETGHTYHNIFKSKEDALKFFEDEITSKINNLQKRLEAFKMMD